jgi:hypothetical protein
MLTAIVIDYTLFVPFKHNIVKLQDVAQVFADRVARQKGNGANKLRLGKQLGNFHQLAENLNGKVF